jgi:hypothetical protein
MKKSTLVIVHLLITGILFSQVNLKSSEILKLHPKLSILNDGWTRNLKSYRDSLGMKTERSETLDEHSLERALYFANVLDASSQRCRIKEAVDRIPDDNSAHNRLFGNPIFFSCSEEMPYPPLYSSFKENQHWVISGGEIMQEYVYLLKSKERASKEYLISKMLYYHDLKRGDKGILNAYIKSPSHKSVICNYLNDSYGSAVVYVIHEWFNETEDLWYQELAMVNVTVFGRKTYSLRG